MQKSKENHCSSAAAISTFAMSGHANKGGLPPKPRYQQYQLAPFANCPMVASSSILEQAVKNPISKSSSSLSKGLFVKAKKL